ncbi:hypothetical protein ACN6MT_11230 [Neobacillus niacini]|uniref:hypothetical protein n=1 Tax=Neobacillus niacini TaxID=86668 RepID=UPI003B0130A8
MKPIRVILHNIEGFEVTFGYLIDEETTIVFYHNQVWLGRSKVNDNDVYEITEPMSLLGEQKQVIDLEDYAKRIIKHLKNTSLFSYIVQKHFYDDQDIDWKVTNI